MKKIFAVLNVILVVIAVAGCVVYDLKGGLVLKGITSSWFTLLGGVNLVYAFLSRVNNRRFPLLLALGLFVSTLADIALNIEFLTGALIFAVGHVLYFAAYCALQKFRPADLLPIGAVFALSMVILCLPIFDFGSTLFHGICLMYGLIISFMVGKAAANLRADRSLPVVLLLVGSVMFYVSDLMLVLNYFADAPQITDTLCLYLYFPGQTLLAHTLFHWVNSRRA